MSDDPKTEALLARFRRDALRERGVDEAAALAALEAVDLVRWAGRDYTTLSGGERQRVHLARVLAQLWPGGAGQETDAATTPATTRQRAGGARAQGRRAGGATY